MRKVYFDNAATTQLRSEVIDTMTQVLQTEFGNPSSTHEFGRSSKALIETARKEIAQILNVSAAEIIFTSGGTEADNFILKSCVNDLNVTRIISSKIEHHAVLYAIQELQTSHGISVEYVNLDHCGAVDFTHLEELLADTTQKTLVSLMHINNEIGNILDLKRTALLCEKYDSLFHSDTVQSIGHYQLDFTDIPIDFAVVAAHKFHGPKGVGFAFVRKNSGIKPLIVGGSQEKGLRAGTEPVYAIVGMVEALKISYQNLAHEKKYITGLKDYFKASLITQIPEIKFNGQCDDNQNSAYTVLNVCIPVSPQKGMMLLFQLDLKGIACSKGSACQSGSSKGSHVLSAILKDKDLEKPSIRFSFSSFNTKDEVDYVVQTLNTFVSSGNTLEH